MDGIKVKGSFRLALAENGEIVGDSGWVENQIVNDGFRYYLCYALGSLAGSAYVTHLALGSGGAPASNATTLGGEVVKRQSVTAASSNTSKAVLFTGTFSSANSFVTNTQNISNVGLFNSSAAGSMFAGNTFASSSVATNQDVYASYSISFT
jgi:hypothetical protein